MHFLRFLLELEPAVLQKAFSPENAADFFRRNPQALPNASLGSRTARGSSNTMEATATSIQAFFEENVSVPEVRAVLLALEGVAEARRLGLRLLQGAMSGLRESNSWVTKACLLHLKNPKT